MHLLTCAIAFVTFSYIVFKSMRFFRDAAARNPGVSVFKAFTLVLMAGYTVAIALVPREGAAWQGLAWALFGASLGIYAWAVRTNDEKPLAFCFTGNAPQHVQKRGPYGYVRHPFYTSYLAAYLAGAIAVGSWLAAVPFVAIYFIYWRAATGEERDFARSSMAQEYADYRRQTGMFLPKLTRE